MENCRFSAVVLPDHPRFLMGFPALLPNVLGLPGSLDDSLLCEVEKTGIRVPSGHCWLGGILMKHPVYIYIYT